MKFAIALISLAVFALSVFAQDDVVAERKIIKIPKAKMPVEAKRSRLGGKASVLVTIDDAGNVTAVNEVTGPDWVCPSVTRPDVLALREAARAAAMRTKFEPAGKDGEILASTAWLNFNFGKKAQNDGKGAQGKGRGVSPIEEPPSDYKGPVDATARTTHPLPKTLIRGWPTHEEGVKPQPKPSYPSAARAVGASGAVPVQVLIDEKGKVFSAEPISGHPLLRSAARTAACKAEFSPTLLSGQPVKVTGVSSFKFVP